MKKTTSAVNKALTDQNIDLFCSSIEKLLNNIKSKSNKSQKKDFMLDQVMFDDVSDE